MATVYKVLGQSAPSATTNTNLYTVPANTQTVVSTISVANRGASNATFRIAVRVAGEAISSKNYIFYDSPIPANASLGLTIGMTLSATDVVTVYSSTSDISFSMFGSEIT